MAASTLPPAPRTGADTEATPGSRSAALAAQPRLRTLASVAAVNLAPRSPRCIRSPSSQASSTCAAEPAVIGSAAPTGTVSRRPLARSAAATQHADVALPAVQLRALSGQVTQLDEHRLGEREQPVFSGGRGQLGDPRSEHEPALHVPGEQPVMLERDGDAVGGRPGQAGGADELREGGGTALHGGENRNGFVQHADAASIVHVLILPSQIVRRKSPRGNLAQKEMDRMSSAPRTLAEKIWDAHVVRSQQGEPDLLFIDLHLVHEVTSAQAFDGLRAAGRKVRRPDLTIATEDHNVPTTPGIGPGTPIEGPGSPVSDPVSRTQLETLRRNAAEFGVRLHPMGDAGQGIVHVIGPQLGLTQPGMTIVCGDSHTSTHGAFGAIAFGIGTSEVEHVLATQTLPQIKPKTMAINVEGALPDGVTAKDLILAIIAPDRHRRRPGLHRRVPRRGDPVAVDGRPADGLQHVHRGGRAGRAHRPGRDHVRVPQGPPARSAGRRLGRGGRVLAERCPPTRARSSTTRSRSTRPR